MTSAKNLYPNPISWAPSQWWDGVDGEWSSFDLRVGTPEQTVRVLPSTAGSATWVVTPEGCESEECSKTRGGLFNLDRSNTWAQLGNATLALEQNLGRNESGTFGLDTISLGLTNTTGGPTLKSQIIAGIETQRWYNGILGLQQQPMNISSFANSHPTFLSTLRAQNHIPSLSWAYTAGARYRSKGIFGSLTFGGSDLSKYVPTNVTFSLAPDVQRDLVVGIQSITSTFVNGSMSSLLPSPTLAFIDSTVPYLYLPEDACKAFETALGLVYNEKNNLYFVDRGLRQTLSNSNPKFTFRLGNDKLSDPTIEITLPYASFDLVIKPPLRPNATSYFPLRRGNDSQITLGRAFLQEAYVMVDYDRKNFTVAQAVFNETAKPNIVPFPWNATAVTHESKGLSRQATIGVSTGIAIFALLAIISGIFFALRCRRRRNGQTVIDSPSDFEDPHEVKPFASIATQELGDQNIPEMHDTGYLELLNGSAPSGSDKVLNELADESAAYGSDQVLIELADGLAAYGSDQVLNEMPCGRQTPCELYVPPTPKSHKSASPYPSTTPTDSSNDANEFSSDSVTPPSSAKSTLSMTTTSPNITQDGISTHRITKQVIGKLIQPPMRIDVNKALPQDPVGSMPRCDSHLSPWSRFAIDVPATTHQSIKPGLAHRHISEAGKPLSRINTYANVFDIEEYQDRAAATKAQHGSV